MIIRQYGHLPTTYAPDIGEVVQARRTPGDPLLRAVVLDVKRRRDGALRVKLQWLESNPNAGVLAPSPISEGDRGWVVDHRTPGDPPLIQQVDQGAAGQP